MARRLPPLPALPYIPAVFTSLPSVGILLLSPPPIQKLDRLTGFLLNPCTTPKRLQTSSYASTPKVNGTNPSPTQIFAYRDDMCSHLSPAGNKLRKLAYVLPHALSKCDPPVTHLVTVGGIQSNCCRQTAMVAAHLGLKCIVVQHDNVQHGRDATTFEASGNVQLEKLLGAEVRRISKSPKDGSPSQQTQAIINEINAVKGQQAFLVPVGASLAPSGGVGYARWVFEMLEQEAQMRSTGRLAGSGRFDSIVVACASGSTLAGIIAGMRLAETLGYAGVKRRVVGVEVFAKPLAEQRELVLRIARDTAVLLGMKEDDITQDDFELDGRWSAGAYGHCDLRTRQTLKILARTEALLLDPVYTGKAMTAVLDGVAHGELTGNVLFLHTGGQAALSAYVGIESDE